MILSRETLMMVIHDYESAPRWLGARHINELSVIMLQKDAIDI
jgi:hypothetical protein